jgi:glucans biosynthesis protein
MHGGARGSGAPNGNQNAFKHGFTSNSVIQERKHVKNFIKECRKLITQGVDILDYHAIKNLS